MTDLTDETVLDTAPDVTDHASDAVPRNREERLAAEYRSQTPARVPRAARVLGAVGRFLITAGIVVFLFVAYELWGTNIQEARAQDGLRDELDERFAAAAATDLENPVINAGGTNASPGVLPTPASTLPGGYDPEMLELLFPPEGEALARVELPSIGVDKVVVRGVDVADLRRGPGHYPGTPLPGNPGNTSIAGHRTTYGAPFNRIDELSPGDEIVVTGVQGEFTYQVMDPRAAYAGYELGIESIDDGHVIVDPDAVWVLADFGDDRLTLTACHPKLSSRQRIIVAAELVSQPVALPEWADKAHAAQLSAAAPTLGADEVFDESVDDTGPIGEPTGGSAPAPVIDLDGGLTGEREAIPGAAVWMLGAIAFWVGGGLVGRRLTRGRGVRFAARLTGLMPALVCLWFAFEKIDRALPAG